MPWSRRAAAAAACALLAACGTSGTSAKGTAPVPTAPTTTSDPWAVPATITPDYLNKVLAKLNQIDGDAYRTVRASSQITADFIKLEASIRADDHEVALAAKDWQESINDHFAGIKPNPGNRVMTVTALIPAPSPCELASVNVDFTAVTAGAPRAYPQWFVGLLPSPPSDLNPTRWRFVYDGFENRPGPPDVSKACATS